MGTFTVSIQVGDFPAGRRYQAVEALVDTGATYPVVPRSLLVSLGVTPVDRQPFALADGRVVEYDVGLVSLHLQGRALPVLCVFGEEGSSPMLGAVALETFGLAVDPVERRLIPVPRRLMGQL